MEKEKWAVSSTPKGNDLVIVQSVLSLYHFLHSYIPQNLGVLSKLQPWQMDSILFLRGLFTPSKSSIYSFQKHFTVDVRYPYTNLSLLGVIFTHRLMNPIDRITNRATTIFSGLPTYDLRSLGCILYHRLFGSSLFLF